MADLYSQVENIKKNFFPLNFLQHFIKLLKFLGFCYVSNETSISLNADL